MVVQEQLLDLRTRPSANEMTTANPTARTRAREPEQLVELFADDVWRFVSSQVSRREDAEDVVMEVFAVAVAKFQKLQAVESQRHWLLAVARRKSIDCLRRQYRRAEQPISADVIADDPPGPGHGEAAREALKGLPSHQSQALLLKYVNGLSTEEVSEVIGKSMKATNSLLQRARMALRAALTPVFPDEVSRES